MRSMLVQVPMLTGYAGVTRVEVSVPYVAALIADGGKYYMQPKHLEGTERRRYAHRGPTLRGLVKLAMRCQEPRNWAWRSSAATTASGSASAWPSPTAAVPRPNSPSGSTGCWRRRIDTL